MTEPTAVLRAAVRAAESTCEQIEQLLHIGPGFVDLLASARLRRDALVAIQADAQGRRDAMPMLRKTDALVAELAEISTAALAACRAAGASAPTARRRPCEGRSRRPAAR